MFVLALLCLAGGCLYSSVFLLGRVSPALFPGKNVLNAPGFNRIESANIGIAQNQNSAFNEPIRLLIMGVDARPGDAWDAVRTDTIMVASLDPRSKTLNMISFPRDMWVDIHPDGDEPYQQRINASFEAGAGAGGGSVQAGAKQLQKDLRLDFGIETSYYVVLNFHAAEQLVDAIGGIDVDVPEELAVGDWYYSDDDQNGQMISLPAGPQHLDGYHAVALGRSRDGTGGDFYRIKRQQLVIEAALAKALSGGVLNPASWPSLWDAYSNLVHTNVPYSRMPGLASLLKSAGAHPPGLYSAADPVNGQKTMYPFVTEAGAQVLDWDPAGVQYWIRQALG